MTGSHDEGWTVVTLKEHFDVLREDMFRLSEEIRAADMLAIEKAEKTLTVRLEAMNEFRAQIQQERGDFVRREFIDQQIAAGLDRHAATNGRIDVIERVQFKIIGGLVLATVIAPLITAIVVYLLTRHAIPTGR